MTYTHEQVNTIVQSYTDEIVRLLNLKTELKLQILNLKLSLNDKNKELSELKKATTPTNGTVAINSEP